MNMLFKKLRGKICSFLAKYPISHTWPTFWWRVCGYQIGKNTRMGEDVLFWAWHHLDTDKIRVEDDVSIGPRVILIVRTHSIQQIENYGKVTHSIPGKITIGKGAWIGAGSIILPNVSIGERAVVGAGSVVTKDVPPYTVVAGVPAREIKKIKIRCELDQI